MRERDKIESSHTEHIGNIEIHDVIANLGSKFIKHEVISEELYYTLRDSKNAIVQGAGGYGKSEMVIAVCEALGVPYNVHVCNSGTTIDDILGPINIKKFLDEGVYEVNYEEGLFRTPGVLVLEEGFDAPLNVLTAIKDILTRKSVCYKGGSIESLVTSVIIVSNTTVDILKGDPSKEALLDRFSTVVDVDTSWSKKDYNTVLSKVYPEGDKDKIEHLSHIFSATAGISPRKAIDITDIGLNTNRECLIRSLERNNCGFGDLVLFSYHASESKKTMEHYMLQLDDIILNAPNKTKDESLADLAGLKEKASNDGVTV